MNRPWEGIALALFLAAYCAMGMPTQSKEYQMEPLNHVDVVYTWVNGSDAKHRQGSVSTHTPFGSLVNTVVQLEESIYSSPAGTLV